jgi:hypothetical protein
MYNDRFLQMMYQQWSDGQSDVTARWRAFVELAARHNAVTVEVMLEELKKYQWFSWRD